MGCCIGSRKEEDDWKAESDMRTLMEAEEIRKDAKRHARATAKAKEKLLELATVAGNGADSKGKA